MAQRKIAIPKTWPRYILLVGISVFLAVLIVDFRVVEAERDGCERRQPIFSTINSILIDAQISARERGETTVIGGKTVDVAEYYEEKIALIDKQIVRDCDKAYPPAIPFLPIE